MTEEQKRIAIAEACGWKAENYGPAGYEKLYWRLRRPDGTIREKGCTGEEWSRTVFGRMIPNYLNDLNAMHEAEKVLALGQRTQYCFELRKLVVMQATVDMLDPDTDRLTDLAFYGATASQRADAFLLTIGERKSA